jgi:hypothetical protein
LENDSKPQVIQYNDTKRDYNDPNAQIQARKKARYKQIMSLDQEDRHRILYLRHQSLQTAENEPEKSRNVYTKILDDDVFKPSVKLPPTFRA